MCYSYRDHQMEEEARRMRREAKRRGYRGARQRRERPERVADKDRELVRA